MPFTTRVMASSMTSLESQAPLASRDPARPLNPAIRPAFDPPHPHSHDREHKSVLEPRFVLTIMTSARETGTAAPGGPVQSGTPVHSGPIGTTGALAASAA